MSDFTAMRIFNAWSMNSGFFRYNHKPYTKDYRKCLANCARACRAIRATSTVSDPVIDFFLSGNLCQLSLLLSPRKLQNLSIFLITVPTVRNLANIHNEIHRTPRLPSTVRKIRRVVWINCISEDRLEELKLFESLQQKGTQTYLPGNTKKWIPVTEFPESEEEFLYTEMMVADCFEEIQTSEFVAARRDHLAIRKALVEADIDFALI